MNPSASLEIVASVKFKDRSFHYSFRASGKRVALVGPSGSGKSTLLRVLAGVENRVTGRICFENSVWLDSAQRKRKPPWLRRVGWVPQDALLFPHLSVWRNLSFSNPPEEKVVEVSQWLKIGALLERNPRHLSGGEKQRVAIGRALLSQPRLLLLDEPFSALEQGLRQELLESVANFCTAANMSLVLVTHRQEEGSWLCPEKWIMNPQDLSVIPGKAGIRSWAFDLFR